MPSIEPDGREIASRSCSRFICGLCLAAAVVFGVVWAANELHSAPRDSRSQPDPVAAQVTTLIRQLDHPRAGVRREAVVRLAALGPAAGPAVPRLMGLLQDPNPLVRAHAARAVCRVGLKPQPVVPILAELLRPQRAQSCCLAALILGDLGEWAAGAVPALRSCLSAPAAVVRLHAAEAILKIVPGDDEALDELLSALQDEESDIRYFAVNALGAAALDFEAAHYALERTLSDADTNVASAAALNLAKNDDRLQSLPAPRPDVEEAAPLSEVLQLISQISHSSPVVRRTAAIRLGLLGRSAAGGAAALRERLDDPDLVVRVQAARSLWTIEPDAEAVLPVLVDLLGVDEPNVTVAATQALARMGDAASAALPTLRDLLEASEFLDRLVVAAGILSIDPQDQDALLVLTTGLHDPEGDVRYLAAIALGMAPLADHKQIESELRGVRNDRNLRVQSAVSESLKRLRSRLAESRNAEGIATGQRAEFGPGVGSERTVQLAERSVARTAPVVPAGAEEDEPEPAPIGADSGEVILAAAKEESGEGLLTLADLREQFAAAARSVRDARTAAEAAAEAEDEPVDSEPQAAELEPESADSKGRISQSEEKAAESADEDQPSEESSADATKADQLEESDESADEAPGCDAGPVGEVPTFEEIELAQAPAPGTTLPTEPAPQVSSDDGLKPISAVRADIRAPQGPLPDDPSAAKVQSAGAFYHGYGARRGWEPVSFGWDAPAMYFKPLYFQDVNLERYGRHFGCYQPFVSWGMFYYDCLFLPYKLIAQPPCECKYTLGYNRPNNCVPLECCRLGYPSLSKLHWNPWRAACCTCPVHPADPWNCHDDE